MKLTEEQKAAIDELALRGELTPEKLLEEAENPEHPCHDLYEWDDAEAARQYRLGQSHQIIVNYRFTVIEEFGEVTYRKHTYVSSQHRYMDGQEAVTNFRDELEKALYRDMKTLVNKHRRLGLTAITEKLHEAWRA